MKARWVILFFALCSQAFAQAPSPAQMGINKLSPIGNLSVLDRTNVWVPIGSVNSTTHTFSYIGQPTITSASGSGQTTSGLISASSSTLTLSSAIDFKNGQGISVWGAGPSPTVTQPIGISASYTGSTGSHTYSYQIASLDGKCGMTAAAAAVSVSSANITNTGDYHAFYNYTGTTSLSWTAGSGSPLYVIWRSTDGGAYTFLAATYNTSWTDRGFFAPTRPGCIPATPPASAQNEWLVTNIVSGGGTTTLVLGNTASNSIVGGSVLHDDSTAINSDIATMEVAGGGSLALPCGNYNITQSIYVNTGSISINGYGPCTSISTYGVNWTFFVTGVSNTSFIYRNSISNFYAPSYNQYGNGFLYAQYSSWLITQNITIDHPWNGINLYDTNTFIGQNIFLNNFWGNNTTGFYAHSGSTSSDYGCCYQLYNFYLLGNAAAGGTTNDKYGIYLSGNVATIQGWAVTSDEIEGTAVQIDNAPGNPTNPEFVNITDLEIEFPNNRGVDIEAGSHLSFANPQLDGAKGDIDFVVASPVSGVMIEGGFINGAKCTGGYFAGKHTTVSGTLFEDNSESSVGGTPGTCAGFEVHGTGGFTATGVVSGSSTNTQSCGAYIAPGANHFNISGTMISSENNNCSVNNAAGTSSSQIVNVAN